MTATPEGGYPIGVKSFGVLLRRLLQLSGNPEALVHDGAGGGVLKKLPRVGVEMFWTANATSAAS